MEKKEFFEVEEKDYRSAILEIIRSELSKEKKKELLYEYHDNDIASAFDELTIEEREVITDILGAEAMSEILPYIEDVGEYLSGLDANEAADIIEQMDADEALEALDELDDKTRLEVMELVEKEAKEDIELLDSYDDDEFGSKMSTNFISVKRSSDIKGAMRTLVREAEENDNIFTIFVTEEDGSFYGAISLKELIVARSDVPLCELISTNFPYVCDKDMISDNIERLRSYSEELIPVISSENGILLGVITSNDIIDIVDEELGDDYAKLAALSSEEESDEGIFQSMKKRVPWLVALLFMGLAVSAVVGLFENVVKALPLIVSFQSLILGMAGNVGTQSLAVTVRTLGSNERPKFSERFRMIFKETRVAFFNGLAIGLISFIIVFLFLLASKAGGTLFVFEASGCVGIAMFFAMLISGFTGAFIPIALCRLGVDPAVASGPLITTVNDLVAVVSYYGLAWGLLLNFGR